MRTALSRMVAAGELEAADGRYRLAGPAAGTPARPGHRPPPADGPLGRHVAHRHRRRRSAPARRPASLPGTDGEPPLRRAAARHLDAPRQPSRPLPRSRLDRHDRSDRRRRPERAARPALGHRRARSSRHGAARHRHSAAGRHRLDRPRLDPGRVPRLGGGRALPPRRPVAAARTDSAATGRRRRLRPAYDALEQAFQGLLRSFLTTPA